MFADYNDAKNNVLSVIKKSSRGGVKTVAILERDLCQGEVTFSMTTSDIIGLLTIEHCEQHW